MANSSSRRELQGPRPPPLAVSKASWKVKKPAAAAPPAASSGREPVVVYLNTPKVIHARPEDFRSLVQRLTGRPSASSSAGGSARRRLDSPTAVLEVAEAGQDGAIAAGDGSRDVEDPLLLTLGQLSSLSSVPSPIISPSLFFCSPGAQASLRDLSPLF